MKLKLSDQPVGYVEALKSVLALIVLLHLVHLSGAQVAGIERCIAAVLGVFVWTSVTPNAHVDAKIEAATQAKEAEIHSFLADAKLAELGGQADAHDEI